MASCSSTFLILVSFQTNVSPHNCSNSLQSLRPWRSNNCLSFSYTGRLPQGAQCTVRGKNDLKDKIACRLVHGDCNMCGVDVYHLLPSFSLLYCFLFLSSSFLPFLSLLLPARCLLSSVWGISLMPRPSHTFEKEGVVFWVTFLSHGTGSLSNCIIIFVELNWR